LSFAIGTGAAATAAAAMVVVENIYKFVEKVFHFSLP